MEQRVPRNASIATNYRNHRQVDGIATRKDNGWGEKKVASVSFVAGVVRNVLSVNSLILSLPRMKFLVEC